MGWPLLSLSVGWCLVVLAVTWAGTQLISRDQLRGCSSSMRMLWLLLVLAGAFLLMRPHEHTFQGLDTSAYRLMARAFQIGRPLTGADEALLEAPAQQRRWLLLESEAWGRRTRDRAFQVMDLDSCRTQPYFYPQLPLFMVGFDALVPGKALDYGVPLLAVLALAACLSVAVSRGGALAGVVMLALWFGSPVAVWLLRGANAESPGVSMLVVAVSLWLTGLSGRALPSLLVGLLAGLACCFHPLLCVPAVALVALACLSPASPPRSRLLAVGAFAIGVIPLVATTLTVAQPYGALSVSAIRKAVSQHQEIRWAALAVFMLGAGLAGGMLGMRSALRRARARAPVGARPLLWLGAFGAAALPTIAACVVGERATFVRAGLRELLQGQGWALGLLWAVAIGAAIFCSRARRERQLLIALLLVMPVFLYLKGIENLGLWSQRRLLPPLLLAAVAAGTGSAPLVAALPLRRLLAPVLLVLVLLAAAANPLRWPAPWVVRCDEGADAIVDSMAKEMGDALVLFDYYHYSVPFASRPGLNVFGVSEFARGRWDGVADWARAQAGERLVFWATAHSNPGLEAGVVLRLAGHKRVVLDGIRSRGALPAERRERIVDFRLLRVEPVGEAGPLVVEKVFDGMRAAALAFGLAVRGPWGRGDISIKTQDAGPLPAQWSVEGSQVVGPVPVPGNPATITLAAVNGRRPELPPQELLLTPPWGGSPVSLVVSNAYGEVVASCMRPAGDTNVLSRTGLYTLNARVPYDPAQDGIRGFRSDLGALIHRIRIEIER